MSVFTGYHFTPDLHSMLLLPPKHMRTFESRHRGDVSDYMATGLSVAANGDLLVADLGMDRVLVFSPHGRCKLELKTQPCDEPTSAVALQLTSRDVAGTDRARTSQQCIMVACRSGLRIFNSGGQLLSEMTPDIKCPQYIVTDARGNVIVNDMLDGGSTLVTWSATTAPSQSPSLLSTWIRSLPLSAMSRCPSVSSVIPAGRTNCPSLAPKPPTLHT